MSTHTCWNCEGYVDAWWAMLCGDCVRMIVITVLSETVAAGVWVLWLAGWF